ncbi:ribosomal protein S18-alanine N-acetyltransferase [Halalkalicoccus salilacus]|uniref:ribosomal protein S18-alanine N-acetyltransferase n=1 Tax=Halalkalicoccus TaxID=332246 RepID=UPI002F96AF82
MSAVEYRKAERADLLSVFRIEKASFPQPWPFSAFERFLGQPGFLVAHENEDVIGFVVADSVPNHGRTIGHVKDLAVRPERRGRGIGRGLLERAMAILSSQGAGWVKLEVREGNDPALALYRESGFTLRRRIPRYYDDGETALVLVAPLRA